MAGAAGCAAEPGQAVAVGPEGQLFGNNVAFFGACAFVRGVDVDREHGLPEGPDDCPGGWAGVEDVDGAIEVAGDRVGGVVVVDDDERRTEECLVEA
nr:hypothetical protein [Amycolatopsis pretoriensis]